jgi:hypothetical protein
MESARELLEKLAMQPFESCEAEWRKFLKLAHLGLLYVPAIQEVLREGRWRVQPNPAAYVRKAARRCARKLGLVYSRPRNEVLACELGLAELDGERVTQEEMLDLGTQKYKESRGRRSADELYGPMARVAEAVLEETSKTVDWDRAAELADLDQGERLVLELRAMGFSRRLALKVCWTDKDKSLLEAAWKRLERHQEALKEALKTGKPQRSRRLATPVEEFELIMVEQPDDSWKFSFRKLVPKSEKNDIYK